jgi:hypothetical protein
MKTFNPVADEVQETLDWLTDIAAAESLDEVVKLVGIKEPALSQEFKSSYRSCTWWDGDYYCQNENWRWHLVDISETSVSSR